MTLADWLTRLEALHPKSIELGLDRVRAVARRLDLALNCPTIVVAGTNGKGSTCAMLASMLRAAGYRVGSIRRRICSISMNARASTEQMRATIS